MNWLDIVIPVILLISTLLGLRAGMIKAVLSLAGLILGVILAGHYYVALSKQLPFISRPDIAEFVAFAIILLGVLLVASMLAWLSRALLSAVTLGWLNRLGGAIFGLVLGAILCGALLAIWVKYTGPVPAITESVLAAILLERFPLILALLPEEFDGIRSFFQGPVKSLLAT